MRLDLVEELLGDGCAPFFEAFNTGNVVLELQPEMKALRSRHQHFITRGHGLWANAVTRNHYNFHGLS